MGGQEAYIEGTCTVCTDVFVIPFHSSYWRSKADVLHGLPFSDFLILLTDVTYTSLDKDSGRWPQTSVRDNTNGKHAHIHSFTEWRSHPRSPCPNGRRQYLFWTAERYTTSAVGTASSDSGVINIFLTTRPDCLDTFYSLFTRACRAGWLNQ